MEKSFSREQVVGEAHPPCKDGFAPEPPLPKSLAVIYCFSIFFSGNKPSGFLPAVTARLLRVLYSEGKSDGWERSGGVGPNGTAWAHYSTHFQLLCILYCALHTVSAKPA